MALTLVLGPANSAKAGEVLGAYALAAQRDALLVVPTAADAAHYDRELVSAGVVLGRSLTFSGLIAEIARRAGHAATRLTALQQRRLLREVVARLELPALAQSAAAAGFPAAAGRLIGELTLARVGVGRLAGALRAWAGEDPERAAYASDLVALYGAYDRALERLRRVDSERWAWSALDALRAAPARWGQTPVFFYGFDDLTRVERDAVETLALVARVPVTVSLTYETGRAALAARATVAEDLRGQAQAVRELPSLDEHYAPGAAFALSHVERHLFEPAPPRIDPGEVVRLLEAGGERAEAELVAAEVLGARRDGVPPEDIVVVCRSLARSGALLERVLERYGVAAWSARAVALGHTSLGRALLGLARCALVPDPSAADLLAFLRAPGVAVAEEVDALEAAVARRAVAGFADALELWGRSVDEIELIRAAPAAELAGLARRLLEAPRRGSAARLDTAEQLDARAAAAVLGGLAELTEMPGRLDGPELLELLEGLQVPAHPPAGQAAGAVLVSEPLAIRARRFRRVIVSGLCEGEFPVSTSPEPFLGEERRRELAVASGLVLPPEEDGLARERYLLYACVSRATERLTLSYRSSDEEGNLVLPSPFLADLAELFVPEWWERRRRRLLADVVWEPPDAPTARERLLSDAAAGACGHPAADAVATRVLGAAAMGHVRHRELLSGGALESFADCPVKWLVENQLQPQELAPDGEALVRGNFMHAVLEEVIGRLGRPLTADSLDDAERALDELVAEPPVSLAAGRPAAVRAAVLRGVEADLRRYLRHEAADGCDWVPRDVELRFGFEDEYPEESLPPLVLGGAGEEAVMVRGVIDRLDVAADGGQVIVRDYKSGANKPERAGGRWLDGRQLQVALYMLAVRRLRSLEPVGGFYQPLTGRDLRPRGAYVAGAPVGRCAFANDGMAAEELEGLLEEIEAEAVRLAHVLRRGELTPCPETCSRDGCRHPGICWA